MKSINKWLCPMLLMMFSFAVSAGVSVTDSGSMIYQNVSVFDESTDDTTILKTKKRVNKIMHIKPTVGRVVWYYPSKSDPGAQLKGQPQAATIAAVWSDSCVNLSIVDSNGVSYSKTSVTLDQGDTALPVDGYAEWMPYQVGQAKKQAETG